MAQFGLIAEEVAEINPDLVSRDKDGQIYTVRYDAVNAMLLNEFLKEHRTVEEQQATIARMKSADEKQQADISELKSTVQVLTAGLKAQGSELQAVKNQMQTQPTAAHFAEK